MVMTNVRKGANKRRILVANIGFLMKKRGVASIKKTTLDHVRSGQDRKLQLIKNAKPLYGQINNKPCLSIFDPI